GGHVAASEVRPFRGALARPGPPETARTVPARRTSATRLALGFAAALAFAFDGVEVGGGDLHPAGSPLDEVQRRVGDAELAGEVLTPAAEAPVGSACGFDGADLGVCGAVVPLAGEACGGFGGERFAPLVGGWEPASDDAVGVVGCRPKLGEERVEGVEVGSGEVGSVVEVGGGEVAGAV